MCIGLFYILQGIAKLICYIFITFSAQLCFCLLLYVIVNVIPELIVEILDMFLG